MTWKRHNFNAPSLASVILMDALSRQPILESASFKGFSNFCDLVTKFSRVSKQVMPVPRTTTTMESALIAFFLFVASACIPLILFISQQETQGHNERVEELAAAAAGSYCPIDDLMWIEPARNLFQSSQKFPECLPSWDFNPHMWRTMRNWHVRKCEGAGPLFKDCSSMWTKLRQGDEDQFMRVATSLGLERYSTLQTRSTLFVSWYAINRGRLGSLFVASVWRSSGEGMVEQGNAAFYIKRRIGQYSGVHGTRSTTGDVI